MLSYLNPSKCLIFRIVHVKNIPWILDHGVYSSQSSCLDPNYENIGKPELIEKRKDRKVDISPFVNLSDYIPFYFTPLSIMSYNIKTGYNGVPKRANDEIVILISSLYKLKEQNIRFIYTDRHAYLSNVQYFDDLEDLGSRIDWQILTHRDFKQDPEYPDKKERYQAEALVLRYLPLTGLVGIACHSEAVEKRLQQKLEARQQSLKVKTLPQWYF